MLATTTKVVACLAAVSMMECKGSAQATEHHEGNNLRAPPTTVPEMPTVQSTDTALLDTDENRMFNFPHGIPPLRMKHPSRASRLPVSSHTDQAKLEDLQRVSLLEKEDPLITLAAENTPTFNHNKYKTKEEMMEDIREMVRSGKSKFKIMKKIARSKMLSHDDTKAIEKAIEEAMDEYRIELKQLTTKWWNEDTDPEEVYKLLGEPALKTIQYNVYSDYKKSYYDHEARLGFEYITWFREKTDPADVLKKLSEMFPGQGKMMTKYHSEYEELFKEYPDIMKQMPSYLKPSKSASTVLKLKKLQEEYTTLSTNTKELFELLYSTWIRERRILSWMKEKKIPDEVYASLRTEREKGSTLEKSLNHLSFLMYRDWWIDTFPDRAVKSWMKQQKELHEVFALLKLDSVPEHELSVHPMYPHYLKYRNWWIVTYPDKALESWKKGVMDPDDVIAVLESLEESDRFKMRPYSESFMNWWFFNRFPNEQIEDLP